MYDRLKSHLHSRLEYTSYYDLFRNNASRNKLSARVMNKLCHCIDRRCPCWVYRWRLSAWEKSLDVEFFRYIGICAFFEKKRIKVSWTRKLPMTSCHMLNCKKQDYDMTKRWFQWPGSVLQFNVLEWTLLRQHRRRWKSKELEFIGRKFKYQLFKVVFVYLKVQLAVNDDADEYSTYLREYQNKIWTGPVRSSLSFLCNKPCTCTREPFICNVIIRLYHMYT